MWRLIWCWSSIQACSCALGEFPEEMVELAAIGTIADLVSLTDENRTIAKLGIAQNETNAAYWPCDTH